jgi:hypothetical protein
MGIKLRKKSKKIRRRERYKKEKIPTLVHTQDKDYNVRQDPNVDTHTLKKGEARMIRFIERGKRKKKMIGGDDIIQIYKVPSGDQPHYIKKGSYRKPIKKKR